MEFDEWAIEKYLREVSSDREEAEHEVTYNDFYGDLEEPFNAGKAAGMEEQRERDAEIADELHLDWNKRHCTNQDAAKAIRAGEISTTKSQAEPASKAPGSHR